MTCATVILSLILYCYPSLLGYHSLSIYTLRLPALSKDTSFQDGPLSREGQGKKADPPSLCVTTQVCLQTPFRCSAGSSTSNTLVRCPRQSVGCQGCWLVNWITLAIVWERWMWECEAVYVCLCVFVCHWWQCGVIDVQNVTQGCCVDLLLLHLWIGFVLTVRCCLHTHQHFWVFLV